MFVDFLARCIAWTCGVLSLLGPAQLGSNEADHCMDELQHVRPSRSKARRLLSVPLSKKGADEQRMNLLSEPNFDSDFSKIHAFAGFSKFCAAMHSCQQNTVKETTSLHYPCVEQQPAARRTVAQCRRGRGLQMVFPLFFFF